MSWSPIKPPTPEVEIICQKVKSDIEILTRKTYTTVTPQAFKDQNLQALTSYKILVMADSDYLTITVCNPPGQGKLEVIEFAFQPQ